MRNALREATAVAAILLVSAPAAGAAEKPRLSTLGGVPASVQAGGSFRITGKVASAAKAKLTVTLRSSTRSVTLRSARAKRGYSLKISIPRTTRAGTYTLRVCVRRGATKASCKSKRVRVTAIPAPAPTTPPAPAPAPAPTPVAPHSLRAPLTGENFYFVMADRFKNANRTNDKGNIASDDPDVHGYDPTKKGFFHGGDLQGLLEKIDYIQGLGTTAIWLTPSFKNRAVQGPPDARSAGYHGYWVTDFTQIDPHFGTNAELRQLVDAAHARGIKVFFDIITNHTADVIAYTENRYTYVSKDTEPFRTASGTPFDDRDFAGTSGFPELDANVSFPLTPYVPAGIESKTPAWLNDLTLYHNRGDTTFVGEDSLYGDFFGLDDLFTEHPRVVDGMIDIYETWIRDLRIDGFRIDTMKHVNDEFWQKFSPTVLQYAKDVGKPDFFMFGEVADGTRPLTSHYTTHNNVQSVLDFPFQEAARAFASKSGAASALRDFFVDDDYYTDADSNAYQLPTFLGNHDAGHVGMFIRDDNPAGTTEDELLARDKLAHGLMYLTRGNPVVYFGDEQGYTGAGNDQAARQDLFRSVDLEYDNTGDDAGKNDNIGSPYTPVDSYNAEGNFWTGHPLYREIAALARLTKDHPALRNGAQQHRYSAPGAGVYAFSRIRATDLREYVVAMNNAETAKTAEIPTWMTSASFDPIYGANTATLRTDSERNLTVTVPPLSVVVYRARGTVPASGEAPSVAVVEPAHNGAASARMPVRADVGGDSFYEVTFFAKIGDDPWEPIGTDDNAPYRVFHDVYALEPGTGIQYKAVVLDNAGHTRESAARSARVGKPSVSVTVRPGARTEVRATTAPELSHYFVTIQRRLGEGPWVAIGSDDSSPVYIVFDTPQDGATYRAVLDYGSGTVTSAEAVPPPPAIVHYRRSAGDYLDWGVHVWGEAVAAPTDWAAPQQRTTVDGFGAVFEVVIADPTKRVNFIVHRPSGDSVPTTREPGGDRFFIPAEHNEIWLKQGDPTIYFSPPE